MAEAKKKKAEEDVGTGEGRVEENEEDDWVMWGRKVVRMGRRREGEAAFGGWR